MCHGTQGDATGVPPRTIWGYGDDPVRVGAHAAHVKGGPLASPIACATCHVVPADALSPGHVDVVPGGFDPSASVTFSGVAASQPSATWDRPTRTCSVYCHGSSYAGTPTQGGNVAPDWTGGAGEVTCGSCHALPPAGDHPNSLRCGGCHPGYAEASVAPETHVNGLVEVQFDCSGCHGDPARPPALRPAPPVTASGRPAGAHLAHLTAIRAAPLLCTDCHDGVVPVQSLPTHVNGVADVRFGARAASGGATPGYLPESGCSATYCHGSYSGVYEYTSWNGEVEEPASAAYEGARATPRWTDGPTTCASCHGAPPATGTWHTPFHGNQPQHRECQLCHPDATSVNGVPAAITLPAMHVDGVVDVTPLWASACFNCH
jgi:predicted CxxxxCH...CXXCH cytochrome family protein